MNVFIIASATTALTDKEREEQRREELRRKVAERNEQSRRDAQLKGNRR
ncbi:hypothetical protein [Streptomyces sp. ST2-7A]|nr:hypothetical protein [Streptomyces sp. ST2-7A]MCE7081583.1 hypothetical protein [Streptomyces sp. ST2-7A]